jgi:hypothetical protein
MRSSQLGALAAAAILSASAARGQTPPHCPIGYVYVGGHTILRLDAPPLIVGGHCQKISQHPDFQPVGPAVITPDFYLITILYSVPGEMSEVKYSAGASLGSKTETSKAFKAGITAEVETNISDITAGYSATSEDGHSIEVKKEDTTILLVDGVADPQNAVNHDNDVFYIWVNPQVSITQVGPEAVTEQLGINGSSMQIVSVTAGELKDPTRITAAWKQQALAHITAQDRAQLLSLDPLASGAAIDKNARYIKIDTLQLDGPDNAGDPVTGQGLEVDSEQTVSAVHSTEDEVTLTVMFGGAVSLGVVSKVMVGGDFAWTWKTTNENSSGTIQKYEVALKTAVVGFHSVVDLYEDTLMNSMVFAPRRDHIPLAFLTGLVKDAQGRPLANQVVNIADDQGATRRVVTNSHGIYRLYDAREGKAWVGVGAAEQEVMVARGSPSRIDLEKTVVSKAVKTVVKKKPPPKS